MGVPTITGLGPDPQYEDVVKKINSLVNELRNVLLTLDTVNVLELNAEVITAGSITADKIAANTITANEIAANTITADKMNVTQLSAISANLGTIIAGSITSNAEINVGTDAIIGNKLFLSDTNFGNGIRWGTPPGLEIYIDPVPQSLYLVAPGGVRPSNFYFENVGTITTTTPTGYSEGALVYGTSVHGTGPHYYKSGGWYAISALAV